MQYEYSVIPAPARGEKIRGAKSPIERFSLTLSGVLNDMAADGWDYVRAEALPTEERSGLAGRTTVFHNILIFRRPVTETVSAPLVAPTAAPVAAPPAVPAPAASAPVVQAPVVQAPVVQAQVSQAPVAQTPSPEPAPRPEPPRAGAPVFSQPMRLNQDARPAPSPRLGPASK